MQRTENYNLKKPDATDAYNVEDFNGNMDILDSKLNGLETGLSSCARISCGSYVGIGGHGSENPNVLRFDFTPKLVFVRLEDAKAANASPHGLKLVYGSLESGVEEQTAWRIRVSWKEKSVEWYSYGEYEYASHQMNELGVTYRYVAIG